jgi:surfeit locus 1 family protein
MMRVSPKTFFSRRWWWVTLVVIGGMLFLARLGVWQLERLEWRRGLNAATLAQLQANPLDLTGDLSAVVWQESRNRQATAVGKYDYAHEFIVVSQVYQNQSGNVLLTPLLLDEMENTAVLVHRGWIPNSARADLSQFQPNPDEPAQVQGYLQLSESLSSGELSTINPETREIFRLDLAAISQALPYQILPVYLQEAPPAIADGQLPYRTLPDLSMDEGDHFVYALQWFTFSLMLGVIYVIFVNKQGE